jgi:hypothetical protein
LRACAEPHILFIKPKTHSHGAVPSSDKSISFSISHCTFVKSAFIASRGGIIKQSNIGSLNSQDFLRGGSQRFVIYVEKNWSKLFLYHGSNSFIESESIAHVVALLSGVADISTDSQQHLLSNVRKYLGVTKNHSMNSFSARCNQKSMCP